MRISIIGTGYLGAVHAACMAASGHEVLGVDVDPAKLAALSAGRPPFFELGPARTAAAHRGLRRAAVHRLPAGGG